MWPQLEQTRSACLSAQLKVGDEIQDNRDPKNRILARMCYAAAIGGNGTGVGAKVASLTFQERLRVHHCILTDESRKGVRDSWFGSQWQAKFCLPRPPTQFSLLCTAHPGGLRRGRGRYREWVSWNIQSIWLACTPSGRVISSLFWSLRRQLDSDWSG